MNEFLAFLQVVMIDVSLSGDNAIIIALAAAGLPIAQRKQAIFWGICAAIILRAFFAVSAVHIMGIKGVILAGGIMLAWICWKMFCELRENDEADQSARHDQKTMPQAIMQIIIADVSMSLDNVLAVAGAAREHIIVMVAGLVIAIGMMAVAANLITGILKRWPILNYVGLALIVYVSGRMIYDGFLEVLPLIQ